MLLRVKCYNCRPIEGTQLTLFAANELQWMQTSWNGGRITQFSYHFGLLVLLLQPSSAAAERVFFYTFKQF